ncbi:hypothetical protein A9Q84_01685 [Halobacteriovorax marinus]|uniref:Porin domain-containing protein n=1 Tax=Halobacteriovorax marinus TaxID=97084 RepID=A0A1Y5FCB5_9BACT|nr:hypothetical protein A9Q84_01685 [Halobacteriovorax marinus]
MKRLLLITSLLLSSATGFANNEERETLGDSLDVSAVIRVDNYFKPDANGDHQDNMRIKGSVIKFTATISENIKAVIALKLDRMIRRNGDSVESSIELEEFLKYAYVEIRNIGGKPIAVVIGKKGIPMGLGFDRFLNHHNNPVRGLRNYDQVFGITVTLDSETLGKIQASVFENLEGSSDLDIGSVGSYAIRYSREIMDGLEGNISYAHLGHDDREDEDRISIGAVYKTDRNTFWAEGIFFTNHATYGDATAINAGASRTFKFGEAVAAINFIEDHMTQLALGLNIQVNDSIRVGPEVRYSMYDDEDRDDEVTYGIRTEIRLRKK